MTTKDCDTETVSGSKRKLNNKIVQLMKQGFVIYDIKMHHVMFHHQALITHSKLPSLKH